MIGGDIQQNVGIVQVCAGQAAGIEAAIYAMQHIYENDNTEALLLVDAANVFNVLNQKVALHNISILCPVMSIILQNTYGGTSDLYVGREILALDEGTTQGDPLAMSMYTVAITPLIHELQPIGTKQVWFTDDATGGGTLKKVRSWWDQLNRNGPVYSYHPKASKLWLIVKEAAKQKRLLGAAIGNSDFKEKFTETITSPFVQQVSRLAEVAQSQPQAAHAAFTHGLIGKWTFLTRTSSSSIAKLLTASRGRHNIATHPESDWTQPTWE